MTSEAQIDRIVECQRDKDVDAQMDGEDSTNYLHNQIELLTQEMNSFAEKWGFGDGEAFVKCEIRAEQYIKPTLHISEETFREVFAEWDEKTVPNFNSAHMSTMVNGVEVYAWRKAKFVEVDA